MPARHVGDAAHPAWRSRFASSLSGEETAERAPAWIGVDVSSVRRWSVCAAIAGCGGDSPQPPEVPASPATNASVVEVGYGDGARSPERLSLPNGTSAVLSVPRFERGRLGIVFTQEAQRRVLSNGIGGADVTVRFTACPAGGASGRTGWPGGFVIDEPPCATVTVNPGRLSDTQLRTAAGPRLPAARLRAPATLDRPVLAGPRAGRRATVAAPPRLRRDSTGSDPLGGCAA